LAAATRDGGYRGHRQWSLGRERHPDQLTSDRYGHPWPSLHCRYPRLGSPLRALVWLGFGLMLLVIAAMLQGELWRQSFPLVALTILFGVWML